MSDIADAVAEARAAENETHTDTCTITRPDPAAPGDWDPVNGSTPGTPIAVHAGLPCRVREPSASDRASVAGEHLFQQGDATLRLDAATTGIRIGDTVSVTSSLQGVATVGTFTVVWPISGSHMSSARFVIRRVA